LSEQTDQADSKFGELLALFMGIGLVASGVVNTLCGGGNVVTTILVLIGAGALSGFVKARQKRLGKKE
jgi:sugar phosphate permease